MNPLKQILAPFASLKLTVTLLVLSMVLVLAGTTAQRDMGIQDVQHEFFHSWVAKIYVHYFQPTPTVKPGHTPADYYLPGWLPLPGGYSIIIAMLVNLLAAHTIRFKLRWNRAGIIMIHGGLILLLLGEMVTSFYAVESQMRIDIGGSSNYTQEIHRAELAVIDPSPADRDNVVVVPQARLVGALDGAPIHDTQLPFDVKVDRWYENSMLAGPVEQVSGVERLATAGAAKAMGVERRPKINGTEAEMIDVPSAFVTLSKGGQALGTYLVSAFLDPSMMSMPMLNKPQEVMVDGKTYQIALRFKRDYKPYTITLKQFTHDLFPGTDIPRDYASTIRLVDPSRHVDREVRVWMNHPLRFAGETFYQQSFTQNENRTADRGTILQVVHNPAWTWPYIACTVGGLGLVLHFSITLLAFLRRRMAPATGSVGASARRKPATPSSRGDIDRYTLAPQPMWQTVGVPLLIVAIMGVYVLARVFTAVTDSAPGQYDLDAFGRLPVSFEGRVQPIDSVARNMLSIVSGRESFTDEKGQQHQAIEWLLDVMSRSGNWAEDKVVRIDHPQVKDMLGLPEAEKRFSWNDIFKDAQVGAKLDEQSKLAAEVPAKQRDPAQAAILELHQHLGVYLRFFQVDAAAILLDMMQRRPAMMEGIRSAIDANDPQFMPDLRAGKIEDPERALRQALMRLDESKLTSEQRGAIAEYADQMRKMRQTELLDRLGPAEDLFFAAPLKPSESWQAIAAWARRQADPEQQQPSESAVMFLKIIADYQAGQPGAFNTDLTAYQSRFKNLPEISKVGYEVAFNRYDPFKVCEVFYVLIFILAFCSWLFWAKPMWRSAYGLLILALLVHTIGLASRIYLSGRPPVTNLYSASVFIGWGVVVFSIALELIFRNGVGLIAGSAAGFMSLLVAAGFAAGEGDTMKQLQAVLDTNFWLATHVVCVTLGYTATILAGVLAIVYLLRSVFSSTFAGDEAKDHARMVYGIVCFAMLFSFVGTILGGIWADQSWGRFWGWDPKENGAVLVVLWNALILHARWGGMARERGVMGLAVLGNIVTGWSFVGTNLLGIGLHSYGFMSGAQMALIGWMALNLALASLTFVPARSQNAPTLRR